MTASGAREGVGGLRILAIGDVFPWPARDGYRLRFASILSGLATLGSVDLFVCAYPGEGHIDEFPDVIDRHRVICVPFADRNLRRFSRLLTSPLPNRILKRKWKGAEPELREFARPPYDVVWFSHADSYSAFRNLGFGPAIVDLDNLEDLVIERLRGSRRAQRLVARNSATGPGRLVRRLQERRERWSWSRLQRDVLKSAAAVAVCSSLDRERLNSRGNVLVVPNGYADPKPIEGNLPSEPVLLMIARFTYEPNLAGAHWFVHEVFARLRESVPEARLRLVGKHDSRIAGLGEIPNVELVGEVEDVGPELQAARGVVVPLMTGGGTRLKVLEAFAYGRPVISTSVGVEGFDIEPGKEALVADNPESFAELCSEVLLNGDRSWRIAQAGRKFFLEGYQLHDVHKSVVNLVATMPNETHSSTQSRETVQEPVAQK